MGVRAAAALAIALLTGGCSLIFGEVDKTECQIDDDCFEGEICVDGLRCEVGRRPVGFDMGRDMDLEPEPDPDLGPDLALDAAVDLAVDAAPIPDADPATVVFPAGDCFEGDVSGTYEPLDPPLGALHVPGPACTPFARLWTARTAEGVELAWDLDGDAVAEGRVPSSGTFAVGEGVVFASAPRDADGRRQLLRVELRSGDVVPVRLGAFDQRDPVHAYGRLAFVESGSDGVPGVLVIDGIAEDDPAEWECARADAAQWGPALGPRFMAWFEQPRGSRRTRVVVNDGPVCDGAAQRQVVLDGAVPADARLWALDDGLVWLEPRVDGPGNRIRRWRFADPSAGVETLVLDGRTLRVGARVLDEGPNPVELAAYAQRLAVVRYRVDGALRYVLDVVDLTAARERAVTRAGQDDDARAPWLSASYLLWAEADRLGSWRVAYERLD